MRRGEAQLLLDCQMAAGSLIVKAALKKLVPPHQEAGTSDICWLLPATTCRDLVAFCTGIS